MEQVLYCYVNILKKYLKNINKKTSYEKHKILLL